MRTALAAAVAAALTLTACGGGGGHQAVASPSDQAPAAATPASCHQQWKTFRSGPGWRAIRRVGHVGQRIQRTSSASNVAATMTGIERMGALAGHAERYPLPRCIDPRNLWIRFLKLVKKAGNSLRSAGANGPGALTHATRQHLRTLLTKLRVVKRHLAAELNRTVGKGHF